MKKQILKLVLAGLLMLLFAFPSFAIELDMLSVRVSASDCSFLVLFIPTDFKGEVDDSGGNDYFSLVLYDGYGNPFRFYASLIPVSLDMVADQVIGTFPPTSRPITIKAFEASTLVTSITEAESGALLDSITFDPADFGVCADLPLIVPPRPENPQPAFSDGRINNWDTGNPVVLYGHDGETGRGLVVYSPEGELLLLVSAEQIAAVEECPAENSLIASAGDLALYRLTDCRYQLNAPSLDGTKTYVLIFNDLYENTGYTSYEE